MWGLVLLSLWTVPEIPAEVAQYVSQRVAYGYEPAIAIALVSPEDQTFLVVGHQEVGGASATADTVFEIGSISKVFTAILLSDFVERGMVGLDDAIQEYLPEHVTFPVRGDTPVTLRHLATHTSGLPRLPTNLAPKNMANPYADYSFEQLYTYLNQATLSHDPGKNYAYSNLGAGLLGHLLERIRGRSYAGMVNSRICEPLEMKDTVVVFREDQKSRIATGYETTGEAVSHWDLPTLAGAGALRSTVRDMAKFVRANLEEAPHSRLGKAMVLTHSPQHTMAPGSAVGLGWHILDRDGQQVIWHNGGTGGFRSFCGFDLKKKLGVVVLSNSTFGVDPLGLHLLNPKVPLPPIYQTSIYRIDLAKVISKYIGEWQTLTISKDEIGLYCQVPGYPPTRIYPMSETVFFSKTENLTLEFERNAAGEVTGVVSKSPQGEQKYQRQREE